MSVPGKVKLWFKLLLHSLSMSDPVAPGLGAAFARGARRKASASSSLAPSLPVPPDPGPSIRHPGAGPRRGRSLVERHVWPERHGPALLSDEFRCRGPRFAIGCVDAAGKSARISRECRHCGICVAKRRSALSHVIKYAFSDECLTPVDPGSCVFVTLTMPRLKSRFYSAPECDPAFLAAWHRFVRSYLRAAWRVRWFRIFERQKDGTLHVHLIVDRSRLPAGYLPDVPARSDFSSSRQWLRSLSPEAHRFVRKLKGYGFGPIAHVRPFVTAWRYGANVRRDSVGSQVANYLSKYAVKSLKDPYVAENRTVKGSTLRLHGCSRSWPRRPKQHVPFCVDRTFDLALIDKMPDWELVYTPKPGLAKSLAHWKAERALPFKLLDDDLGGCPDLVRSYVEAEAEYARAYARSRYPRACSCGCGHTVMVSPGVDDHGSLLDDSVAAARQRADTAYSRIRATGARASRRACRDWWQRRQAARPEPARPEPARPPPGVDPETGELLSPASGPSETRRRLLAGQMVG